MTPVLPTFVAEARVRCSGQLHRIGLTTKGRLVLCDHRENGASMAVMESLIGRVCRCHAVLEDWRNSISTEYPHSKKIPDRLRNALHEAVKVHATRAKIVRARPHPSLVGRVFQTIVYPAVVDAAESCDYRIPTSRWVDAAGMSISVINSGIKTRANCFVTSSPVWASKRPWRATHSHWMIYVNPLDFMRVRSVMKTAPCAVERGKLRLVLALVERRDDDLVVIACRQGKGYDIYPQMAILKHRDNEWRLARWLPSDVKTPVVRRPL